MTCIAALKDSKGKIWIGGDHRISMDDAYYKNLHPKVWKRDGMLLAYAGDAILGEAFARFFPIPDRRIKDIDLYMHEIFTPALKKYVKRRELIDNRDIDAIIALKGRLYSVDLSNHKDHDKICVDVIEIPMPYAIGSGSDYALGSLLSTEGRPVKERLTLALEIASRLSSSCDNNILIKHE